MMNSFIEWLYEEYQPEKLGERYSVLRFILNFIKFKSYKSETLPTTGLAHVELMFHGKPLASKKEESLLTIKQQVDNCLNEKDTKDRSPLKLRIFQERSEWGLYWLLNDQCWGLAYHEQHPDTPRWIRNLQKVHLISNESRSNSKTLMALFLTEYVFLRKTSIEEQFGKLYRNFVRDTLNPIKDYLFTENKALRNDAYILKCRYVLEGFYSEDSKLVKIYLDDPGREFMGSGVYVRPQQRKDQKFSLAISEEYLDDEEILLVPAEKTINWPQSGILEIVPNLHTNRRKREAIDRLESAEKLHLQRLLDLLTRPQALPEIEPVDVVNIKEIFQRGNFESKAQCDSIDKVFGCPDLTLIQGPPGTGKTEVICEIVLQIIRKGGRVLLTSPTNVAVDNVLDRIHREKGVRPIRIGHPSRIRPEMRKYLLSERTENWIQQSDSKISEAISQKESNLQQIQTEYLSSLKENGKQQIRSLIVDQANFVCGTCIGAVNLEFSEASLEKPFDLMIIDEASKASLIEFLVPAVRAKKWVLVGDHRQLAPYVSDLELKIYLQKFLEDNKVVKQIRAKIRKDVESESSRDYFDRWRFDDKVEEIMKYIRRYHEEFHNLDQDYSREYLDRILHVFNYERRISRNFIEMVEFSLGSSFHYFWRRIDETRKAYLPIQHRMPLEIAKFLNTEIYDSMFNTSRDAELHGYNIKLDSKYFASNIIAPTIFIDTSSNSNRQEFYSQKKWEKKNILESNITQKLVDNICKSFPLIKINPKMKDEKYSLEDPFRIGVITFYSAQAKLIREKLSKLPHLKQSGRWSFNHKTKNIQVRVSIVDRFQGQEQEIIILSLVRSNKRRSVGFLTNLQRLNVGLSRARHNMLIIGDFRFFLNLMNKNENSNKGQGLKSDPKNFLVNFAKYYQKNKWVIKYINPKNKKKKQKIRETSSRKEGE